MKSTFFLLCLGIYFLSGCTTSYLVRYASQTHFDYPNSNVEQLGYVSGEASESHFFSTPQVTSTLQYDAITNALGKKPGADMLINAFYIVDVTSIPMLPINTITYRVDGTAVRMKVSDKSLGN